MLSKVNKKIERKEKAFEVFIRARRLGKTNLYFAGIHRRSSASISMAFKGELPSLLGRIEKHIFFLEKNNGGKNVSQQESENK